MIGPRVGLRVGPRVGLAIGVGADQIGSSTGVSTTTMTAALADSADPTPAGANFDYTLVVTNTGSISATSVSAAITLDASLAFVSASGSGWTCNAVGQVVTCTRATMSVGVAPAITITVTAGNSDVTASTSVAVTAANATEADDTETTGVVRPTMTATLNDSPATVINGKNVVITFDLTNNGTGTINTASATVVLDANLTWVSTTGGSGWTLGHSGQNVTATKAAFAQGAIDQIVITATAANSATVSASTVVTVTAANAANATDTEATQLNFIARDATSLVYLPASSTEWTNFIAYNGLAIAVPVSLWLCQEASGNLADSIGSVTLTAGGTVTYQEAVTGWARKAVKTAEGGANGFTAAAGVGINPSTTSVCFLALADLVAAPAANRNIMSVGGAVAGTEFALEANSATGNPRIKLLASTANGTVEMVTTGVNACAVKYDRTGGTAKVFTSGEKLTAGTYSSLVTDGLKGLGATIAVACQVNYLYACTWSGANGEMSDATLKAALVAMGLTIAWS